MRFIVCSSMFHNTRLSHHIYKLAREGVSSIEVWADGEHHFNFFDDAEVNTLRIALHRSGVKACALHAPYGGQYDLSSLDHSHRQRAITACRRAIEVACAIGADIVIMHPSGRLHDAALREEALKASIDSFAKLVEWAEKHNTTLAIENLTPIAIGDSPFELLELIASVSSERLRVCFDTGHANISAEGLIHSLHILAPHIVAVHWNDNDGFEDLHLPPGRGRINWQQFFSELSKLPKPKYISLEAALPPNATLTGILRSILSLAPKDVEL
ncbi:MAG: sugar phosphate isomerase/epimerase family protein [Armatimonadota bacterium]|nr:sugar phosphate isomerase/epimerase [Armatimonadota bacterium]MCX7776513.1 sugar phosphate isomerase/epimerase [Armatimonadota bacterium]MDW8024310.1 sugar phosphate isomerase/epimerase family protein [Armatimonadota bacterium]